jgi:hypothetical protein
MKHNTLKFVDRMDCIQAVVDIDNRLVRSGLIKPTQIVSPY